MDLNNSNHLSRNERVKLGGYYTPDTLVEIVHDYVYPYVEKENDNLIVFDNAAGYGAFIVGLKNYDYRLSEYDKTAYINLTQYFDNQKVFYTNSLLDVTREKFNIPSDSFLIMIGNPPYNDTTSEFRNGEKGKNQCDEDLFDRDLGISFLKSYNKMEADVVCILHPLSYLIKKPNFRRLRAFKNNYCLRKSIIFPSSMFPDTGSIKFPITISLYEKDKEGMDFEYILDFSFDVLGNDIKFKLSDYQTTDGFIRKYPPTKKQPKQSPIGLYYYTFRDFNSLKKNTSFLDKPHYNGIVVTLENFYQYAYLDCLKRLFKPDNDWLYGNLSPLMMENILQNNKKKFITYSFKTHPVLINLEDKIKNQILNYYNIDLNNSKKVKILEKEIKELFRMLI